MKRAATLLLAILLAAGALPAAAAEDAPGLLRVLAYDRTVPREISRAFTAKTGIGLDITTAVSSIEAAGFLYSNKMEFDLLILSTDVLENLRRRNRLLAFDHKKIPNLSIVKAHWRHAAGDPACLYRIPLDAAAMGILVDTSIKQPPVSGYADAFQTPRPGGVAVMVDQRDLLAAALLALGASVNDLGGDNICAGGVLLRRWLRNISPASEQIWTDGHTPAFDSLRRGIVAGRHGAALLYSGDALSLMSELPTRFKWINPVEGSLKYLTVFSIPKDAKRPAAAHRFIDFLLAPEVSAQIAVAPGFGVPLNTPPSKIPLNFHGNPGAAESSDLMDEFSLQADITREPISEMVELFRSLPRASAPPPP
jgi:spermidine/putrescine transport system substrate-binding protein